MLDLDVDALPGLKIAPVSRGPVPSHAGMQLLAVLGRPIVTAVQSQLFQLTFVFPVSLMRRLRSVWLV